MPAKLEFELKGDEKMRHGYYLATMLHGVMMALLDTDYADKLHANNMHPFSQFVTFQKDKILWHIQMLSDETEQEFLKAFSNSELNSFYLKHRQETLDIVGKRFESVSEENLLNQYYFGRCAPVLKLRFCTPTSFKQDGHYVMYPTVRLIFQSLMLRHDAGSEKNTIYSKELLDDFEKHAVITGYRLKSSYFYTDHVKIPGFLGEVTIHILGPQQMINLAWFLAVYGTYSGVGIKTGLGMGGMMLIEDKRKKDDG